MNSNRATLVLITVMLVVLATVLLSGCSEETSQTAKTPNFVLKYEQDPELLEPLDVPVENASDEWCPAVIRESARHSTCGSLTGSDGTALELIPIRT